MTYRDFIDDYIYTIEQIKALRKLFKISSEQFSKEIGCSRQTLSNTENGHRDESTTINYRLAATIVLKEFYLKDEKYKAILDKKQEELEIYRGL